MKKVISTTNASASIRPYSNSIELEKQDSIIFRGVKMSMKFKVGIKKCILLFCFLSIVSIFGAVSASGTLDPYVIANDNDPTDSHVAANFTELNNKITQLAAKGNAYTLTLNQELVVTGDNSLAFPGPSTWTVEGNDNMVKKEATAPVNLNRVLKIGSTVTLNNVAIDGTNKYRACEIVEGSTLNLYSGAIIQNGYSASGDTTGGIHMNNDTKLCMKPGSKILGNILETTSFHGGAIRMIRGCVVDIDGAVISGNHAVLYGGAIWVDREAQSLSIKNTTFTGNQANNGGAIYSAVTTNIENCTFNTNTATSSGGAIYMTQAPNNEGLTVTNTIFTENKAKRDNGNREDGGAIYSIVKTTIEGGIFEGNIATREGGAIYVPRFSSLTVKNNTTFSENIAKDGGAIYTSTETTMTINKATFQGNTAKADGGGLYVKGALVTITETTFNENHAQGTSARGNGGGIYADKGNKLLSITNTNFSKNTAKLGGGAVCSNMPTTIRYGSFEFNTAENSSGGAIAIDGGCTLEINKAEFSGNRASVNGGAIYAPGHAKSLIITSTTFSKNTASIHGGAIHSRVPTTIEGGSFEKNKAESSGGAIYGASLTVENNTTFSQNEAKYGGAIYTSAETTISKVEFKENTANADGGGIYASTNAEVKIDDTIFWKNSAQGSPTRENGGAIFAHLGAILLYITNTNFSENTAKFGGAIFSEAPTTIEGGLFEENTVSINGGAINLSYRTTASLSTDKTTFTGNTASRGGAIFTQQTTEIKNNTSFSGNEASTEGGAIYTTLYSYANPADSSKYTNLNIEDTTVFENNKTVALVNPPDNHDVFTNLRFERTSLTDKSLISVDSLLNNYDINYKQHPTNSYPVKYVFESDNPYYAIPPEVEALKPANSTAELGEVVVPPVLTDIVDTSSGRWRFSGWDKLSAICSDSSITFTGAWTPETTSVNVSKFWEDAENQDGIRPDFVTVKLIADGEDTDKTLVLSDANNWTGSFDNLHKYQNGVKVNYSVEELSSAHYTSVFSGNAQNRFVFTNTHVPVDISIKVSKVWNDNNNQDGKRSDVTLKLVAMVDGQEVSWADLKAASASGADMDDDGLITLTGKIDESYTFENLPVKYQGKDVVYTVNEPTVPAVYTVSYNQDMLTATNTYTPATTSVTVYKVWNDNSNQDSIRPESVTVKLLADGEDTGRAINLTEAGDWKSEFSNLDEYKNGKKIVYTIEEVGITDIETGELLYSTDISGNVGIGFILTNSYTPKTIDVIGSKMWIDGDNQDGKRPDSIKINLYKKLGTDSPKFVETKTVTAAENWEWKFEDLPKYENGTEISYSIVEDTVKDYIATVNGYNVTNSYEPKQISFSVQTIWNDGNNQDGKRPESVTVKLLADGENTGRAINLTEAGDWKSEFSNLDEYKNGKKIVYTIEEVGITDIETGELLYSTDISGNVGIGFILTNSYTPKTIDVIGSKMWIDGDNQDGKRPDSIKINLYKKLGTDSPKFVETKTVTAAENWEWKFEDLPKYENGTEISYSIIEDTVKDYIATVKGYNVTNSYIPETAEVLVRIVWDDGNNQDGLRPNEVEMQLYANGKALDSMLIKLNEGNSWAGKYINLPKFENGKPVDYTAKEKAVPEGYTATTEKDAEGGFIVINSYTPETVEVKGAKTWNDNNDKAGKRPSSVTINLYKKLGTAEPLIVDSKVITALDNWAWSFTNLPKYENGEKIIYTVDEKEVPDGYVKTVVSSAEGTSITNTYETPSKPPEPTEKDYDRLYVPIKVFKVLQNGELKGGEYEFILKDGEGKETKATNKADGTVSFPDRTFTREISNYIYTVHEVKGKDSDILYDNTLYTVKVTTKAISDKKLKADIKTEKNGVPFDGKIVFINCKDMPRTGDNIYQVMAVMLIVSMISLTGAYILKRRRNNRS
jgi:pilin isopeptide linkage protein